MAIVRRTKGTIVDQPTATILAATIAALVAIGGWNVSHYLQMRREDRTRRLEAVLLRTQRQIDEFYGPILNLIEQIFNVWTVRENILFPDGRPDSLENGSLQNQKVPAFFQEAYFFPLHEMIRNILMSKLHLVEGLRVPESFEQYLEHSTQQLVQHRLWKELEVPTDHIPGIPWPDRFSKDVKKSLSILMKRYDDCLHDLHGGGVYRDSRPGRSAQHL